MEWCAIAYMPGFEINRSGEVRNAGTGNIIKLQPHVGSHAIVCAQGRCTDGIRRFSQINVLLEETFGPGAAQAAGMSAPNWERVSVSRERAEKQRDQPKVKSSKNTRACTDCGKPTPNYRCERCWKKRRGFGFANSGDVPEICRERRKKAAPYRPDVFKPLAPRLALPDRQAEFFARQQQTQENTMTKQTYTTSELAAALGVTVRDIANAKYSPAKNPIPGSGVHTVREGMREKNITWEQVVLSRGGRQPGSVKAAPVEAKPPTVAPDPAPVPVTEPAKQDEKFEPILPPVEGKTGGANPLPLSLEELELAVLGMVPLERLLGEVKRRLAGVVTTFSL